MSLGTLALPSFSLPCSNKTSCQARVFATVRDVPADVLRRATAQSIYFSPEFLGSMEAHNANTLTFRYLVAYEEDEALAMACIQCVETDMPQGRGLESSRLLRVLFSCGKPNIRVQVLGNVFLSGQHGVIFFRPDAAQQAFDMLIRATRKLMGEGGSSCSVEAMLVKDFPEAVSLTDSQFKKRGFSTAPFEPNMVLELRPEWQSFTDYLSGLKAKYRTKANKALKESAVLEKRDLTADEIEALLPEMKPLYTAVEDGTFRMASLNLATYTDLKRQLPRQFFLSGYWLGEKLVGFMAAMRNGDSLDAHYVGLDYAHNRECYIYQRILYDYIDLAIQLGVSRVIFGRTATEIKSTVGAVPIPLPCHLRMRNPVLNMGLKSASRKLEPEAYSAHDALKEPSPVKMLA